MDYKKIYDNFILSKKNLRAEIIHRRGDGLCKHHIIPKCIGGQDDESNYVLLTYREHVFAHRLLTRIYPTEGGLALALIMMTTISTIEKGTIINSKELNELDKLSREHRKLKATGIHPNEKTREKQRLAKLGTKATEKTKKLLSKIRTGHKVSEETRKKLSKSKMGYVPTEEHRRNVGLAKLGTKMSPETKNKISGENAFTAKKIVGPNGEIYNTIKDACKKAGCTDTTLRSWIKKHPEKGYSYLNPIEEVRKKKVKGPNGIIYDSIHEASRKTNISRHTIRRRIDLSLGFSFIEE